MQFNTWEFLWFCSAVLLLYWCCYKSVRLQNILILIASFYFYSQLHYSFVFYLGALILVAFLSGLWIRKISSSPKPVFILSVVLLSSCLVILKYTNFGIDIVNGMGARFDNLKFLVPVGLSFYTFSTIGYVTDVYRKKIEPEKDLICFGAYISFFPHLLAGPIPAASKHLRQFKQSRVFDLSNIEPAIRKIIWGLFKKMVVADNISISVDYCFARADSLNSFSLYLGIVLFSFQIYADFSAYSDIARGVAKFFSIDLFQNFKSPFLSRNPGEFWRRWHTSLTRWLTDYLYKPLGGRSLGKMGSIAVILFIFLFSGLWHGSSVNFVLWGLLNGVYYVVYLLCNQIKHYDEAPDRHRWLPSLATLGKILLTFHLITFSRILFKAENLDKAKEYWNSLISHHSFSWPPAFLYAHIHWCLLLLLMEWTQRFKQHPLDISNNKWIRYTMYAVIALIVILYHKKLSLQEYYYFRF